MEQRNLGIGTRVEHLHFGKGMIVEISSDSYTIWFKSQNTAKSVSKEYDGLRIIEVKNDETQNGALSIVDIEEALDHVLDRRLNEFQLVPMALKWNEGTLIMKPADENLQTKELPIETFFHKIIMVRDRIRLIEQKIKCTQSTNR